MVFNKQDVHQEERVVLVDDAGQPIGTQEKKFVHTANTPLHLAFSCYIFSKGKILATQRASGKRVWPSVWTNSVCGHPAPDESFEDAIKRRAMFELGLRVENMKSALPNYRYKTPPFKGVIENEICPVFFATTTEEPRINKQEVDDSRWMSWQGYVAELQSDGGDVWSWWSKDQLRQLLALPNLHELLDRFN